MDFDKPAQKIESGVFKTAEAAVPSIAKELFTEGNSVWNSIISKAQENLGKNVQELLGDFELTGNGKGNRKDPKADSLQEKNAWTVLVQIDATPDKLSAEAKQEKYKTLEKIAKSTEGKSIAVEVQIVEDAKSSQDNGTISGDSKYQLERYEIKNGKIIDLGTFQSEGSAKDIESLEKFGLARNPAEKVALIDNVHGRGNIGMHGDDDIDEQGKNKIVEIGDFTNAVNEGLKDSGHTKLDLLDMDSCMMGQDGFLREASYVTDNLVASPQTEQFPGQNIGRIIEDLSKNTENNGADLGKRIVEEARDGSNIGNDGAEGTVTLNYYDLTKMCAFDKELKTFSEDLKNYIQNKPESVMNIKQSLTDSLKYGEDSEGKRDLKSFLNSISKDQGIAEDEKLSHDIRDLLAAEDNLVVSHFGSDDAYENAGGLSIYVPIELADKNTTAKEPSKFKKAQQKYSLSSWNELLAELTEKDREVS